MSDQISILRKKVLNIPYQDHWEIKEVLSGILDILEGKQKNLILLKSREEIDKDIDKILASWDKSPDRMGGQFTQEEIERSRNTW
jgi:hypothetical protein